MSAWNPGDVAIVLNEHGVWNVAICTLRSDRTGYWWRYGVADTWSPIVAEARPLVVIDPDDVETVERLRSAFWAGHNADVSGMQAALRSLLAPPKPDEPTAKYAVVEDVNGEDWVRVLGSDFVDGWVRAGSLPSGGKWTHYADIAAVRVLSEGVAE